MKLFLSFIFICSLNSNAFNQYSANFETFSFANKKNKTNNKSPFFKHSIKYSNSIKPDTGQKVVSDTERTKIHKNRLILSSIGLIGLNIAAYQPFQQTWWKEERTAFHFYHGWRRIKGHYDFCWEDSYFGHIDKLGHYYSGRILSEQLTYLSRWIGFKANTSNWIGPLFSSLLLLEIEIYDGFFKEWGFSLADLTANELGAFSPLIAKKLPYLKNFIFKLSYHASRQPTSEPTFIKDYAGMTFWLSWSLHSILPQALKTNYPQWLNLALGYSVSKQAHGEVELFLAPDINWEKVPIGKSETAIFIKRVLNYFHFPCFSWKFRPKSKFYPLYF